MSEVLHNSEMDRVKKKMASQLCEAVSDGDPRSVQLLLSDGASPDLLCGNGVAAIHLAVGKENEKNIRCLKLLLQRGADPNVRSSEGLTPLHIAALWGCYQNVKLLLTNGGNPNIKDNEGNTPGQLAEQQENRRCALLLEEYQSKIADTEKEDFPQYQYSVCLDQTDTSGYPETDCSFSSQTSMMSDTDEAQWSSTRRSSFFNLSSIAGRPCRRELSFNRNSGPSLLSSTRVSAIGPAPSVSALKEDALCSEEDQSSAELNKPAIKDKGLIFPPKYAVSLREACRKSVSFTDVDDYFPVFSPDSPEQNSEEASQLTNLLHFNMFEYSDFLDSERMATVLPKQGIDVTSPDHVYVFCRESSESTEKDLEKTVIDHCVLNMSGTKKVEQVVEKLPPIEFEHQGKTSAGSSSGTSSSHYSSCDSDHYTSALGTPGYPGQNSDRPSLVSADTVEFIKPNKASFDVQTQIRTHLRPETMETLPEMLDNLTLSTEKESHNCLLGTNSQPELSIHSHTSETVAAIEENEAFSFTPSPFVTGRTRSRLSRCSLRTSKNKESLFSSSSLFDNTLPAPVRTPRLTPRSRGNERYDSPHTPCCCTSHLKTNKDGHSLCKGGSETRCSPLSLTSSVSNSQADTFILPKHAAGSAEETQSLNDTVILEQHSDNSDIAYERNLAEVILAIQRQNKDISKDEKFLTDDQTSTEEETSKADACHTPSKGEMESFKNEQLWMTENSSFYSDSKTSSASSCLSPRRSQEDSDPPCAPGMGCTPRYSMSRLSCSRPQSLARLSYTPGGRPLIQDLDEPVEYLYTDTEQGHRLIETHVPPTTDTSSTCSGEETILYDWRSMQPGTSVKEKENLQPHRTEQKEKSEELKDRWLSEIQGITDKELRVRLVEMGESPGPISSRTRPRYMQRLCRLLQELNSTSRDRLKGLESTQEVNLGYSIELQRVLHTFNLPECQADEQALCQQFDQPDQNRKWREGVIKSSFNYLLLDPRVTINLPFRSHTMTPQECFQAFVHAVFYVGKGKRSRPYSHLYEALEYYKGEKTCKTLCPKVKHILQVWNAGQGVISLHCFQNVIPVEAYTREACMVEAIGLKMLTNQRRGDFYGVVSNWQMKRKRDLGIHLLYRAMQIFLAEGERQLRPADIRQ